MHFAVTMFCTDYTITPQELAKAAEDRGFESLWLPEHTHIPAARTTPYPAGGELPQEYWHTLDPFGALCAAAATTTKIKLATGICLLIERDTITTAKEVATLDHLSGGRCLFGIGGGWNVEEMANHGTVYKTRFKRLREQVLAMREIWSKEAAEYHGEFVDFDPMWAYPKPIQQPGPPVILGGLSTWTLDRVVDYCDGWLPIDAGMGPDHLLPLMNDLQRRAEAKDRARSSYSVSIFGPRSRPEVVAAYRAAGVDRLVFMMRPSGRDEALARLDQLTGLMGEG